MDPSSVNSIPIGGSGSIDQDVASPPEVLGVIEVCSPYVRMNDCEP